MIKQYNILYGVSTSEQSLLKWWSQRPTPRPPVRFVVVSGGRVWLAKLAEFRIDQRPPDSEMTPSHHFPQHCAQEAPPPDPPLPPALADLVRHLYDEAWRKVAASSRQRLTPADPSSALGRCDGCSRSGVMRSLPYSCNFSKFCYFEIISIVNPSPNLVSKSIPPQIRISLEFSHLIKNHHSEIHAAYEFASSISESFFFGA